MTPYYAAFVTKLEPNYNFIQPMGAHQLRPLHAALGLTTEASELADVIKKNIFYGKPIDETNMLEELGDIAFYFTMMMDYFKFTMEQVLAANQAKLTARYGDKFSQEKANNRELSTERTILETYMEK